MNSQSSFCHIEQDCATYVPRFGRTESDVEGKVVSGLQSYGKRELGYNEHFVAGAYAGNLHCRLAGVGYGGGKVPGLAHNHIAKVKIFDAQSQLRCVGGG